LIFIFDGLDEKLVHYTKDMRQQFLTELMRVFPNTVHLNKSTRITQIDIKRLNSPFFLREFGG
jgi:hypothetical protein